MSLRTTLKTAGLVALLIASYVATEYGEPIGAAIERGIDGGQP